MAVLVDCESVPERDRFGYWSDEIARNFFTPVELELTQHGSFRRRMVGHSLGTVRVFRIEGAPSVLRRTPATIAAVQDDFLSLMIQLRGRSLHAYADKRAELCRGAAVSHDVSRPYAVHNTMPFEMLLFAVPKQLLTPHVDQICARAGSPFDATSGTARLVLPFLRQIGDGLLLGTIPEGDSNVGQGVLHLIKALHINPGERPATQTLSPQETLAAIKADTLERLGDPTLDVARIAALNYISESYLHKLFRRYESATIRVWLQTERLERCRRELTDPSRRSLEISEIAARWGFRSASHFSRVFRAEYGLTPTELRAAGS